VTNTHSTRCCIPDLQRLSGSLAIESPKMVALSPENGGLRAEPQEAEQLLLFEWKAIIITILCTSCSHDVCSRYVNCSKNVDDQKDHNPDCHGPHAAYGPHVEQHCTQLISTKAGAATKQTTSNNCRMNDSWQCFDICLKSLSETAGSEVLPAVHSTMTFLSVGQVGKW